MSNLFPDDPQKPEKPTPYQAQHAPQQTAPTIHLGNIHRNNILLGNTHLNSIRRNTAKTLTRLRSNNSNMRAIIKKATRLADSFRIKIHKP